MKDRIKRILRSRIFSLISILIFISVCLGIGSLIAYIQHESDPTDVAAVYFRAFVGQDYNKMYDCIYREDGYYLDKTLYINSMKKVRKEYVIDSYEIKESEKKEGKRSVTVVCKNEAEDKSRDFVINMVSKRKGLHIIPEFYVDVSQMVAKNFSVVIPKGNILELNGTKITDKTVDVTEKGKNNIYNLSGVFLGKYKISATNDAYAVVKNITVENSNTKVDLTNQQYTANDKYTKLINTSGEKILDSFYKAVRARNPKSSKLIKIFRGKKLISKVQKLVEESQEIVYWKEKKNIENYKVIDMSIKNLKSSITYNDKTNVYTLIYDYSYDYVSSTDTALYTSYVYRLSGKCNSQMTIEYTADKDKVIVKDIKIKNKNKKND